MKSVGLQIVYFFKKLVGRLSPIEEIIGFPVSNQQLFTQAITHSNNYTTNYERLEFLGDAVLDSVVSDWLFTHYSDHEEGQLTILRSRFVSRDSLAKFAEALQLNKVIHSDTLEFDVIDDSNRRVVGDILESLIGAIYIDKGYECAQQFIIKNLLNHEVLVDKIVEETKNFKGLLLEKGQQNHFDVQFTIENFDGNYYLAAVFINQNKLAYGRGKTKKKAEQNAAKYIIDHPELLENKPPIREEE